MNSNYMDNILQKVKERQTSYQLSEPPKISVNPLSHGNFTFSSSDLVKGIIFSEILDKPLSRRRFRR